MDLVQILDTTLTSCPTYLQPIVNLIKNGVFPIIQIGIPIILILMGSIDLGKAVLSSDDKEIKGAVGKLVKRAVAAIAVFFVATLVHLIMDTIATQDGAGYWALCWDGNSASGGSANNKTNTNKK